MHNGAMESVGLIHTGWTSVTMTFSSKNTCFMSVCSDFGTNCSNQVFHSLCFSSCCWSFAKLTSSIFARPVLVSPRLIVIWMNPFLMPGYFGPLSSHVFQPRDILFLILPLLDGMDVGHAGAVAMDTSWLSKKAGRARCCFLAQLGRL